MSQPGTELVAFVSDGDRLMRQVFRQVGWQGQSGAFYALTGDARPGDHEPGSFAPLWVVSHSDYVPDPNDRD
jgi:hypothetical protein